MEHSGDEVLIEKSRAGDRAAFRMLVLKHEGKVAGVIRAMMGATPEAEDLGQEVFIRFYDSLNKFQDDAKVSTNLVRLAINLSLKELKRKKKSSFRFTPLEAAEGIKGTEDSTDSKELLHTAFTLLEPDLQAVATLRLVEGFSTEETAEILEIPVGTALSRLLRMQQKLRLALSKIKTMNGQFSESEALLLKSWDAPVSSNERERLSVLMQDDPVIRKQSDQYLRIRAVLLRSDPDSFGPFFAERIINIVKQRENETEYQILFFFRKYQVIILGVLVALLAANIFLTDELTLKALFGLDEETTEDIFFIDVY